MDIPTDSKEYQVWLDESVGGKSMCPNCKGDLEDNWCATTQISWLECYCGFEHVYEKG